jgi:hypothetical protein
VRSREIHGVTGCETAYYLLSAPLSPARFPEVARVTMSEDQSRTRMDHAPQNLALMRRWALNA